MKPSEGKVALVTGGRSGIGQAIARRFREEGARVFTAQRGTDLEFEWIAADFADPESPEQVVREVIARAGRLDVLVNNAGMMQEARIEDMRLPEWQRIVAVNLTAPFLMIRAALPHLRASRGSIVNIGSIEGLASNPRPRGLLRRQSRTAWTDPRGRRRPRFRRHPLQRCGPGLDRHRPERRVRRGDARSGSLPTRHRPHSSGGSHGPTGGGGGVGGLAHLRRRKLRYRAGLDRGRGKNGATEPSMKRSDQTISKVSGPLRGATILPAILTAYGSCRRRAWPAHRAITTRRRAPSPEQPSGTPPASSPRRSGTPGSGAAGRRSRCRRRSGSRCGGSISAGV